MADSKEPLGYSGNKATRTKLGIERFATPAEVAAGTLRDVAVAPATARQILASPGAIGGTTPAAGSFTTVSASGNIATTAAGAGLQIKEGSNARMGTATLVAGTVTVSNTSVTANTRIFLSRYSPGASTALGLLSVGTVTASTSFVINALKEADATVQANDISVVHWLLVEPTA